MCSSAASLTRLAVGLFGEHRYTSLIFGRHAASTRSASSASLAALQGQLDHLGALDARRNLVHAEGGAALQNRIAAGAQINARQEIDGFVAAAGREHLLGRNAVERGQRSIRARVAVRDSD